MEECRMESWERDRDWMDRESYIVANRKENPPPSPVTGTATVSYLRKYCGEEEPK